MGIAVILHAESESVGIRIERYYPAGPAAWTLAQKEIHAEPPKIVRVYHNAPGKQVYLGSVWMRDVPGAMARVATALAEMNLNLVGSSSSSINGSGVAEWGFFALGDGKAPAAEELKSRVGALPDVIRSDFREGNNGLVVDSLHYPLFLNTGQQAMIIRRDTFADMFRRLKAVFGSGGKVVVHELGMATGENVAKDLVKTLGRDTIMNNHLQLAELMQAQGWGELKVISGSQNPLNAHFIIRDSFECKGTSSATPNSDFIRGYVTAYVKVLWGKSLDCKEVSCLSKGDEHCEFILSEDQQKT